MMGGIHFATVLLLALLATGDAAAAKDVDTDTDTDTDTDQFAVHGLFDNITELLMQIQLLLTALKDRIFGTAPEVELFPETPPPPYEEKLPPWGAASADPTSAEAELELGSGGDEVMAILEAMLEKALEYFPEKTTVSQEEGGTRRDGGLSEGTVEEDEVAVTLVPVKLNHGKIVTATMRNSMQRNSATQWPDSEERSVGLAAESKSVGIQGMASTVGEETSLPGVSEAELVSLMMAMWSTAEAKGASPTLEPATAKVMDKLWHEKSGRISAETMAEMNKRTQPVDDGLSVTTTVNTGRVSPEMEVTTMESTMEVKEISPTMEETSETLTATELKGAVMESTSTKSSEISTGPAEPSYTTNYHQRDSSSDMGDNRAAEPVTPEVTAMLTAIAGKSADIGPDVQILTQGMEESSTTSDEMMISREMSQTDMVAPTIAEVTDVSSGMGELPPEPTGEGRLTATEMEVVEEKLASSGGMSVKYTTSDVKVRSGAMKDLSVEPTSSQVTRAVSDMRYIPVKPMNSAASDMSTELKPQTASARTTVAVKMDAWPTIEEVHQTVITGELKGTATEVRLTSAEVRGTPMEIVPTISEVAGTSPGVEPTISAVRDDTSSDIEQTNSEVGATSPRAEPTMSGVRGDISLDIESTNSEVGATSPGAESTISGVRGDTSPDIERTNSEVGATSPGAKPTISGVKGTLLEIEPTISGVREASSGIGVTTSVVGDRSPEMDTQFPDVTTSEVTTLLHGGDSTTRYALLNNNGKVSIGDIAEQSTEEYPAWKFTSRQRAIWKTNTDTDGTSETPNEGYVTMETTTGEDATIKATIVDHAIMATTPMEDEGIHSVTDAYARTGISIKEEATAETTTGEHAMTEATPTEAEAETTGTAEMDDVTKVMGHQEDTHVDIKGQGTVPMDTGTNKGVSIRTTMVADARVEPTTMEFSTEDIAEDATIETPTMKLKTTEITTDERLAMETITRKVSATMTTRQEVTTTEANTRIPRTTETRLREEATMETISRKPRTMEPISVEDTTVASNTGERLTMETTGSEHTAMKATSSESSPVEMDANESITREAITMEASSTEAIKSEQVTMGAITGEPTNMETINWKQTTMDTVNSDPMTVEATRNPTMDTTTREFVNMEITKGHTAITKTIMAKEITTGDSIALTIAVSEPTTIAEARVSELITIETTTGEPTTSEPMSQPTSETIMPEPTTSEATTSEVTMSKATMSEATTSKATMSKTTMSEATMSESTMSEPTTSQPTTSEPTSQPTTMSIDAMKTALLKLLTRAAMRRTIMPQRHLAAIRYALRKGKLMSNQRDVTESTQHRWHPGTSHSPFETAVEGIFFQQKSHRAKTKLSTTPTTPAIGRPAAIGMRQEGRGAKRGLNNSTKSSGLGSVNEDAKTFQIPKLQIRSKKGGARSAFSSTMSSPETIALTYLHTSSSGRDQEDSRNQVELTQPEVLSTAKAAPEVPSPTSRLNLYELMLKAAARYRKEPARVVRGERFWTPRCTRVGLHLPHPYSPCRFLKCDFFSSPPAQQGAPALLAQSFRCGAGSAVPRWFFSGVANPCLIDNVQCR